MRESVKEARKYIARYTQPKHLKQLTVNGIKISPVSFYTEDFVGFERGGIEPATKLPSSSAYKCNRKVFLPIFN